MDSNHRMPESKSGALPLGDSPIQKLAATFSKASERVGRGVRTLDLRNHNPTR